MKLTAAAIGLILGVAGAAYTARLPPVRPVVARESYKAPQREPDTKAPGLIGSGINPHDIENTAYTSALNLYAFAFEQQPEIQSEESRKLWEKVESEYLLLVDASVDAIRRQGKFDDHDLSEWNLVNAANDVIAACQEFSDCLLSDSRRSDAPQHIAHGPSQVAP